MMASSVRRLVLGTGNPHKVAEMRAILGGLLVGVEIVGLGELGGGIPEEPAETGATFAENAGIKARWYAEATGLPCVADDSGLEVEALGGRPGVISSHYCTDGRETGMSRAERDAANTERVMRELDGVEWARRGARFVCVMALAVPGAGGARVVHEARGTFEGRIGERGRVPRGERGFGYDPIFLVGASPHGFAVTSAELVEAEKNRLSHRGGAARGMARWMAAHGWGAPARA